MDRVYFDNAATTPLDPRVREAMTPYLTQCWGNPSSLHREGREAKEAVEIARRQVAELIGAQPAEIVFTGSGTESDCMAIHGAAAVANRQPCHLVASAIEHPAVLECCRAVERQGVSLTLAPADAEGIVDPESLDRAIRPETRLISVMAANNVLGTIQPMGALAEIARCGGALFHTDAVQAAGKIPINVSDGRIDLLSLSAHKLHGPKGVGALYVRDGVPLPPLVDGGGQEGGRRSGTENVAGIVGFGRAAEIARLEMADEAARLVPIRDFMIDTVLETVENAYLIGHRYRRLPGHLCLGFRGMEGDAIKLLFLLDEAGFAVSSGSACSSNHARGPSHVLEAIGFDPVRARGSLRIALGRFNTRKEAERFVQILPELVRSLRPMHGMKTEKKGEGSGGPLAVSQ
jgi:cysteine desulfurase